MNANADIDALVAMRVMGWRYEEVPAGGNGIFAKWYDADGHEMWNNMVTVTHIWGDRWQPSSNIAQAFQALEQFRPPKYLYRVCSSVDGRWWCEIALLETKEGATTFDSCRESADTAPMCICLAALRVHGIEVTT